MYTYKHYMELKFLSYSRVEFDGNFVMKRVSWFLSYEPFILKVIIVIFSI